MALDSVRCFKLEAPSEGGTQLDFNPTELNPLQDAVTAAGLFVNGPTASAADKTVLVDRAAGGNLRLSDQLTTQILSNLVGSSQAGGNPHQALADFAHFLGAPVDGWASGVTRNVTYNGPLVAIDAWFTNSSVSQTIFKRVFSYSGPLATQVVNTLYNAQGALVRTCTQTFAYNGPLLTAETRTWS